MNPLDFQLGVTNSKVQLNPNHNQRLPDFLQSGKNTWNRFRDNQVAPKGG